MTYDNLGSHSLGELDSKVYTRATNTSSADHPSLFRLLFPLSLSHAVLTAQTSHPDDPDQLARPTSVPLQGGEDGDTRTHDGRSVLGRDGRRDVEHEDWIAPSFFNTGTEVRSGSGDGYQLWIGMWGYRQGGGGSRLSALIMVEYPPWVISPEINLLRERTQNFV